jgi:hypothetical protein
MTTLTHTYTHTHTHTPPPPPHTHTHISSYEGERNAEGQRHGRGVCVYLNGDSYEGEWQVRG